MLTRPAKRKREEDKEKQEKINNGISKYFGAKTAAKAPKAKVSYEADPLQALRNRLTWPACRNCCRPEFHGRLAGRD
jgi:hypothetical protein